jgi:hypothetical protein
MGMYTLVYFGSIIGVDREVYIGSMMGMDSCL